MILILVKEYPMKFAMLKYVAPLVLCALILPQAGWAATAKEFDEKTIPLMGNPKNADKLLKICVDALAKVKNDPEFEAFIHVMKSHAHLLKKEYEKAEKDARIVIDSGLQEDFGHSALREVLFAQKRFDEGLEICLQGASKVRGEHNQSSARQDCRDLHLIATSLTPESLRSEYQKSSILADAKYKNRTINVLGVITSVELLSKPLGGGAKVVLGPDEAGAPGKAGGEVICMFAALPADGKEELPEVGENVIISGKMRGMKSNDIILVECKKIR